MKTDILTKKLRSQLKNSETRLRALRNIQTGYIKVINTMINVSKNLR